MLAEEKENGDGKGKEYLEDENIWTVEEKKNGEGQGGKYLKNEKVITDKENQTKYKKQNSCYDVHLFYV